MLGHNLRGFGLSSAAPRMTWLIGLAWGAIAPLTFAAGANQPDLRADRCVPAATYARVDFHDPRLPAGRAVRVYFHSQNARTEHYIEMRRDASGRYSAVLPKPNADSRYVDYRIATMDERGQLTTREQRRLAVGADCSASNLPTAAETKKVEHLVIGTDVEGPIMPVGFLCDGIIGRIDPAGQLQSYDACSEQALSFAAVRRRQPANGRNEPPQLTGEGISTSGLPIGPEHHRTPRRAPTPPTPPQPRLSEPVSRSRP
jgi:hypothetical protein